MFFFRKRELEAEPSECLGDIFATLSRIESNGPADLDHALELLIQYGEFESAVLDSIYPDRDCIDALSKRLREGGRLTGRIFLRAWSGQCDDSAAFIRGLGRVIDKISTIPLPRKIVLRVPEGYAYYGLYPETYAEAARKFFQEVRPEKVVCIGMRSIGTSLSSVAAATVEELGCHVDSFTVRPRGEPFERSVRLSECIDRIISPNLHYLVVDEGPGLSGSSICSMAIRLSEYGVPDNRIAFLPSWRADPAGFVSPQARRCWQRHRKFTGSFDALWIKSGRLRNSFSGLPEKFTDLSSGGWRSLVYRNESEFPAIHPQHERRKFLFYEKSAERKNGYCSLGKAVILKFAGLGYYGRIKRIRAEQLSNGGFVQPVLGLSKGFISMNFIEGRPLSVENVGRGLLESIADYVSFIRKYFPADRSVNFDEMLTMISRNTLLGLGPGWSDRIPLLERFRSIYEGMPASAVDGRMLPHEWIKTAEGYKKTDCLDHHFDQFFPGCQDIAWDLAGSSIEFGMQKRHEEFCISRYKASTLDGTIDERMPFYKIAYLAFRLGFATYAASHLSPSPDSDRFGLLQRRYTHLLKQGIKAVCGPPRKL